MANCPCGSSIEYVDCCQLYVENRAHAPTPEKLMRSRYVAYSLANIHYIAETMVGKAKEGFDPLAAHDWATAAEWLGLKVLNALEVKESDTKAFVEFAAFYRLNGKEHVIHEVSEFVQDNGRWYYCDGVFPKINRNDECFCGSGKKYKKCCMGK